MVYAKCHPNKQHKAHGLCDSCYQRPFKSKRSEAQRKYDLEYARRYRKEHPEKVAKFRADWRKRNPTKLKIGTCDVCKSVVTRLAKDHDHMTGKLRGNLCFRCNVTLGMVKDNVVLLEALIAYLHLYTDTGNLSLNSVIKKCIDEKVMPPKFRIKE